MLSKRKRNINFFCRILIIWLLVVEVTFIVVYKTGIKAFLQGNNKKCGYLALRCTFFLQIYRTKDFFCIIHVQEWKDKLGYLLIILFKTTENHISIGKIRPANFISQKCLPNNFLKRGLRERAFLVKNKYRKPHI